VLATVNDAFGAASRSLVRSLTAACARCLAWVGRGGETALLAEQRNGCETRLITGSNLVPTVERSPLLVALPGRLGAANRSRATPLVRKVPRALRRVGDVPPSNVCRVFPRAAGHQGLKAAESDGARTLAVNDGRAVVLALQTERAAGNVDDNRTALQAPPTGRLTNFGVPVLLRIFIQLRNYDGRRRTSHLNIRVDSNPLGSLPGSIRKLTCRAASRRDQRSALLARSHKRVEAKMPGQPKPGQGQEAGIAGRAEGASLDQAPVVRQRPSRRSWLGLSQICEPVRQAANGANLGR